MLVDHTHDDIDMLFGRWNMQLKKENFSTIPSLMKSFMNVDLISTIPHFIEEVSDFKTIIQGLIIEGKDALVGHTKAQQFKFYLNSRNILIIKYKQYYTNSGWLLKEVGGIKLRQEDFKGQSLWPRRKRLHVI